MAVEIPQPVSATQNQWRFCVRCCGLFWNGREDNGRCPHDDPPNRGHQAVSWDFYLLGDPEAFIHQPPDQFPPGP